MCSSTALGLIRRVKIEHERIVKKQNFIRPFDFCMYLHPKLKIKVCKCEGADGWTFFFRPISYPDCVFKDVILFDSLSAEIYSLVVVSYGGNDSLRDTQVTVVVAFARVDRLASEYTYRIMFCHKWRNPACQQLGKKRKHNFGAYSSTDRIEIVVSLHPQVVALFHSTAFSLVSDCEQGARILELLRI